tara:strand:- start:203 stop:580 length:378 start_codon:yes stop_codon:yes gene_type:complete
MKKVLRKMKRIKYDSLGRVIKNTEKYKAKKLIKPIKNSNKVMKKDEAILKLENELYNPQPNVNHIQLEKLYSGIYQYKDYIIQKVDQTIKYRPFNYDWKIYKNERYIITVPTLEKVKLYFNSIKK